MAKIQVLWEPSPTVGITAQELTVGEVGKAGTVVPLKSTDVSFTVNIPGGGKNVQITHVTVKGEKRSDPVTIVVNVDIDKPKPVVNLRGNILPD
jgi:hypothetical protein